jgi:hypothetical protein
MIIRSRRAPKWFAFGGAVCLAAGYVLLQSMPTIQAEMAGDPRLPLFDATGRLLFWGGLGLLALGAVAWYQQPPVRRQHIENDEPSLEEIEEGYIRPDGDEDDDLIPCPYCQRHIHEQSEQCPYCGKYISVEDAPLRPHPWIVIGVTVCLLMVLIWILLRG